MKKKGFTLVELLVVIAIIGILASVVLVNLNTARNKAKNATIKASLSEARVAAELYYDGDGAGDYDNFCDCDDAQRIQTVITGQGGTSWACNDDPGTGAGWCAEITLVPSSGGVEWCVDSEGRAGINPASCGASDTDACD